MVCTFLQDIPSCFSRHYSQGKCWEQIQGKPSWAAWCRPKTISIRKNDVKYLFFLKIVSNPTGSGWLCLEDWSVAHNPLPHEFGSSFNIFLFSSTLLCYLTPKWIIFFLLMPLWNYSYLWHCCSYELHFLLFSSTYFSFWLYFLI